MERTRKRKRAPLELQREVAPIVEEDLDIEERGGGGGGGRFKDYPEKPMLSPRAEEDIMPTQSRV